MATGRSGSRAREGETTTQQSHGGSLPYCTAQRLDGKAYKHLLHSLPQFVPITEKLQCWIKLKVHLALYYRLPC